MNLNANYLFPKSLAKGLITNLDLNMHLDSHIYILVWFDLMYSIKFIYFSKVLWGNIVAVASKLGHGDGCKYFQGARLKEGLATQCPAQHLSGHAW